MECQICHAEISESIRGEQLCLDCFLEEMTEDEVDECDDVFEDENGIHEGEWIFGQYYTAKEIAASDAAQDELDNSSCYSFP